MLETAHSSKATVGIIGALLAPDTLPGRFLRYSAASASGTVIDLMAFGLMMWGGIETAFAAAGGYALGTVWHWQVSHRIVFADRLSGSGDGHRRQLALFVALAGMGLTLTASIVEIAVHQGFSAGPAKFIAMCAAFASVWLVRLLFVFADARTGSEP